MSEKKPAKAFIRGAAITLSLLVILLGAFFIYTQDYYRADDAVAAASLPEGVVSVERLGDLTVVTPLAPGENGFIFYPGGKVEESAYLPLLEKLASNGITCVLVKMPFRLAVFGVNRADEARDKLAQVKRWYIGGHSLGGAMAGAYASGREQELCGLILLASYPAKEVNLPAIALYGSEDGVLKREKLGGVENFIEIPGGNHANFGNYGQQAGDGVATISREEQQDICVDAILEFMEESAGV